METTEIASDREREYEGYVWDDIRVSQDLDKIRDMEKSKLCSDRRS